MSQSLRALLCALSVTSCAMSSSAAEPELRSRGRAVEAHTRFLASDLLEGRDAGLKGYDIAAAYVASQFAEIGLVPAGSNKDYYQPIALRRRSLEPNGVQMMLRSAKGNVVLENGKDIAVDASPYYLSETIDAGLVFVGWGITAPALGLDDYAGLDVRGKAVVLLEGAPANLPGSLRAHYSWIQQKERMAAERGAIAILTLKSPARERVSPWERTRQLRPLPGVSSTSPINRSEVRPTQATITLGPSAARALFAEAGHDLDRIYAESEVRAPRGFALPQSMRLHRRSRHDDTTSANVLGVIEGADPKLRSEYIVVASHLDHVGIGRPVNGDTIYNGAVDNAGGVAAMIEVARAMKAGPAPKRSVLFIATTGEEKGLVGSDYFASHPTVPSDRIVAAISVDGLMAFHDFRGIVALGAEHSTLGQISARAAEAIDAVHVPDPIPERGNLALSDQYPFLRVGIPVLFPNPARGQTRGGGDDTAAWDDYESRHYHQPSDDMNLPLRWDVAERWTRYIESLVQGTANAEVRPTWYEGDALADVFAAGRARTPRPTERARRAKPS